MTLDQRIEAALQSKSPAPALRTLVAELKREGHEKGEIIQALEHFLAARRARADIGEEDEDTLLDVLDALHGWCHPQAEL